MEDNKQKKSEFVAMFILIQGIMVVLYTNAMFQKIPMDSFRFSIPVFNFIIIMTTTIVMIVLRKLSIYYKKEAEYDLLNNNISNIEELINVINNQRSNHQMHMQTISTLLFLKKYDELDNYIKDISNDYIHEEALLKDVGHNAVSAIVNAKRAVAKDNRIRFYIRGKIKDNNFDIDPFELTTILSNVLNNAIEACKYYGENSWVNIVVKDDEDFITFKILNRGNIKEEYLNKIFDLGYSTKSTAGKGYGLYIVKQILDKNDATIEVENNENDTVLVNITIPRRIENYDTEYIGKYSEQNCKESI